MAKLSQGRCKTLTYRDQTGQPQHVHQNHWLGFEWEAGNTVVAYQGDWGTVQVWALNEAEGRRVINHACQIAGIPLSGPNRGEWIVTQAKPGRNGKPGRFRTHVLDGSAVVTKRIGPSGAPFI